MSINTEPSVSVGEVVVKEKMEQLSDESIKNMLYEAKLKERKLKAISIARRAIRYVTGYLDDYSIDTSTEITKDYVEIRVRIYFKPPEGEEVL